jgi:pimeloyl-ACP methyl ester carboxylesterase
VKIILNLLTSKSFQDHAKGAFYGITIILFVLLGFMYHFYVKDFTKLKIKAENDFYANKTQKSTSDRWSEYLTKTLTKSQFITLNNKKIAYSLLQKDGIKHSTTLYIIGGLPGIDEHWANLANKVKDRANVVVIHPFGYQPSDGNRTTSEIVESAHYAIMQISFKHNLWDSRVVLAGESMGGNIISHVSQSIKSDVLILQKPMPSTAQAAGYTIVKKDGNKEDTLPYMMYDFIGSPRLEGMLPKSQANNIFMNIGNEDTIVSPDDQKAAFQKIFERKNVQLNIDLNGDHWAFDMELLERQIFLEQEPFQENVD